MMGDGPALMQDAQGTGPGAVFARQAVESAPKLNFAYHWQAFNSLSTERQIGMGPGPIPDSLVERMAWRDGLTRMERETFQYVIRALDNHYLGNIASKNK